MAWRHQKKDAELADQVSVPPVDLPENPHLRTDDSIAEPSTRFPVVGVVASAGGLEAFKILLAGLPSSCGMALILVPHLDSKHKSHMVELLARQTAMPVVEAMDGMHIEVDSVYIIPPNHGLSLSQGRLRLSDLPDPIGGQTAIDSFLRTLALDQGEFAIGIVLSGTGCHGTLGIREVKRCGGLAMAQSPESSEFDQMPRSAIETGLVDFVLPPTAMPKALLGYTKHLSLNRLEKYITTSENTTEHLKNVLELIRITTNHDFSKYRTSMLLRRIERRMSLQQTHDLTAYVERLQNDSVEVEALCTDFLIGVTGFFREPEAFVHLEKELLRRLEAKPVGTRSLRVWIPCCATGEEAYSLAILLWEALTKTGHPPNFQIFASDINHRAIEVARRGIYPASIAADISVERLKSYFVTYDETHVRVSKPLRDSIVFSTQNVIHDPPFSKLDLISCRNFMIYLESETQQRLISLFHYALNPDGLLLLGSAETVGRATNLFHPVSKKWRIYRRDDSIKPDTQYLPAEPESDRMQRPPSETESFTPRKRFKDLTESVLREYSPAAVLIDQRYEVLYVSGPIVDFLEFPTGELSKDLLTMARAGLRTRLRAVCHNALSQKRLTVDNQARVKRNGNFVACSITARPLLEPSGSRHLVLIVLQDLPNVSVTPVSSELGDERVTPFDNAHDESLRLIQLLEYDLKSTREDLQNTIEELETANEELQSANEELESSKEELQSLNEELSTVNCQLLEKVAELDQSNSEIISLMASTEIATLYIDDQLRIKRFTQPTIALFNLTPADEGRDIRDFASPMVADKLIEDCQQVLQTHGVLEKEVYTKDQRCFLRRITSFRTPENQTDGVVVAFVELTAIKQVEGQQRERDACFREIFEHAATGIAIASMEGLLSKCNPAFCKLVGYSEEELRSIHFLSLVHPDDQAVNNATLQSIYSGRVTSSEIEIRYINKNGSVSLVRKFVSALPNGFGTPDHFVALVTDVSAQRKTLAALQQSEERIRAILKTASDAIITIDNRGLIDSVNQSTEKIFGYSSSELLGQNVSLLMPQPFRREHDHYLNRFHETGIAHIIGRGREVLCRRKDGSTFPADLSVSQVDHLGLFTGILRDISSRKEMQAHILEIAADEQRRIGLELHDGTQQELAGLSLYAGALQETIQNAALDDTTETDVWEFTAAEFERLKSIADLMSKRLVETNQHVRDLAHGIMPIQIDAEGLRSALVELAKSIDSNENLGCRFECEGDSFIRSNTTATHLYRIAQEAVNNALRHGLADQIRIRLVLQEDEITLEVSDNGVGFDPTPVTHSDLLNKGMGMRTMEYRASLIGGRLEVEHSSEGGVLVRCEILQGRNV